jgi:hypothetical protein
MATLAAFSGSESVLILPLDGELPKWICLHIAVLWRLSAASARGLKVSQLLGRIRLLSESPTYDDLFPLFANERIVVGATILDTLCLLLRFLH